MLWLTLRMVKLKEPQKGWWSGCYTKRFGELGALNNEMPLLAEAAPDEFLDAVEAAVANPSTSPFLDVFQQEGTGGGGGVESHYGSCCGHWRPLHGIPIIRAV